MTTTAVNDERRQDKPQQALELWREYKRTGDLAARNQLVLSLSPLVKYIVYRKVRELPARLDVEDFLSCGLEALIASLDRFDPDRGASLEQFAWMRIHGAVLDELRRQDWAPRSLRRWERDLARTTERFIATHGRRPSRAEVAELLETTPQEVLRVETELALLPIDSLNTYAMGDEDEAEERINHLADPSSTDDPSAALQRQELKERFREAFADLPERDRRVAVMLYVEERTLREIGDDLGVSESRICQIHGRLKRRLRDALNADDATALAA